MLVGIPVFVAVLAGAIADESKSVEFIGFSSNEQVAAWRIVVKRMTSDGHCLDEITLVRVVDTADGRTMGEFRDSEPKRRRATGSKASCPIADFEAQNPEWARASPRREWQKLKARAMFSAKALALNSDLVRLSRDQDAPSEMVGEGKEITVSGRPGAPVGYVPVIHLVTGDDVDLGHVRREAVPDKAWQVKIRVYHSKTANHVALLHRFSCDGAEPVWFGRVFRLPDAAGTTAVGAIRIMQTEGRLAEKEFKELHPELSGEYEEFVGSTSKP